jgi:hypothetical protein
MLGGSRAPLTLKEEGLMEPQQNAPPIVPAVALVINLEGPVSQSSRQARSVFPLLRSLRLPATWAIETPQQAKMLAEEQLEAAGELALRVESLADVRGPFSNRLATVQAAAGQDVPVVVGDPQQLRLAASRLAQLGMTAVVAAPQHAPSAKQPRPLPCGLWRFDTALGLPQRRWSLWPARRTSAQQLLRMAGPQLVVTLDLGRLNRRGLRSSERLLRDLAEYSSRGQLRIESVRCLAAELSCQNVVKPQRSILRRAA